MAQSEQIIRVYNESTSLPKRDVLFLTRRHSRRPVSAGLVSSCEQQALRSQRTLEIPRVLFDKRSNNSWYEKPHTYRIIMEWEGDNQTVNTKTHRERRGWGGGGGRQSYAGSESEAGKQTDRQKAGKQADRLFLSFCLMSSDANEHIRDRNRHPGREINSQARTHADRQTD